MEITLVSSPEANTYMLDIIKVFSYQVCYFMSPLFVYTQLGTGVVLLIDSRFLGRFLTICCKTNSLLPRRRY